MYRERFMGWKRKIFMAIQNATELIWVTYRIHFGLRVHFIN